MSDISQIIEYNVQVSIFLNVVCEFLKSRKSKRRKHLKNQSRKKCKKNFVVGGVSTAVTLSMMDLKIQFRRSYHRSLKEKRSKLDELAICPVLTNQKTFEQNFTARYCSVKLFLLVTWFSCSYFDFFILYFRYCFMMEIPFEGKHFKLVRDEDLYDVLHYLEYFMPESLKFHQTLKTYSEDHVWDFHFYVSKNWPRDPICLHFPGITRYNSGEIFRSLGLFCPTSRVDCLYSLLDENILIDWTKPLYIHYIQSFIMDHIEYIYRSIGTVEQKCYGDFYIHYSPNELSLIPPRFSDGEARFKILEKKDAAIIHEFYPAKDIESLNLFENLLEKLPSYGIFINDELVAWMIQSYYGAMISMHTKSRFRLLGFGSYIAKYLSKLVAGRGYAPYVLVRSHNTISRNLYEHLGFTKLYTNVRGLLKPNSFS